MTISIIIPTYNEADTIVPLLAYLQSHAGDAIIEIVVSDGGSTDSTVALAKTTGAQVVISPKKGRAAQMNYGASTVTGDVLYFLHADTFPPTSFALDILEAAKKYHAGCYRLSFDRPHWFLKANCWFTRFNVHAFRYGDQSLFVRRHLFFSIGGFCEAHAVFEDYDIIRRLSRSHRFGIIQKPVITSARKYLENGIYKMQSIFYLMYFLYRFGVPQHRLLAIYKKLIRQNKL